MTKKGIEALAEALKAAFEGDVAFHEVMPPQVIAPAVIIVPDEEWMGPSTHGGISEAWQVLVASSLKSKQWFAELRKNNFRVQRATLGVGGIWRGATGPQALGKDEARTVVSVNRVTFRYPPPDPNEETNP